MKKLLVVKPSIDDSDPCPLVTPPNYSIKINGTEKTKLSKYYDSISSLFSASDLESLSEVKKNVKQAFETLTVFRTFPELRLSVLNDLKHPTPDSKYWQLVREMNLHSIELVELTYNLRLKVNEIKQLEKDLSECGDDLKSEKLKIEIECENFHLVLMQRTASARIQELQNQHNAMEAIKPTMKCGLNSAADHQLMSYAYSWTNEVIGINNSTPPADRNNIVGRWSTAINVLKEQNLYEEFIGSLNKSTILKLKQMEMM